MIELQDVSFAYENAETCIHHVNLKIKDGECVVLTGRSGNGKTTLTRLVNGLAPAHYGGLVHGKILIDGKPLDAFAGWERSLWFGNVFQDPKSQFFSGELAGEIAFACENLGFGSDEIRQRTDGTIADMDLEYIRCRPLDVLSSGEKQKVAIASVRVVSPKVYVFDEPSANLDARSALMLAGIMKRLKDDGCTLVVSEHRLTYLSGIVDRYLCLENGSVTQNLTPEELLALAQSQRDGMGLREIGMIMCPQLPRLCPAASDALLELDKVGYRVKHTSIFDGVSFAVRPGQVAAVTGRNGIGKTTLAKVICGLRKETSGEIRIKGKKTRSGKRWRDIWYSSNDINTQLFTSSVEEELLLLSHKRAGIEKARELLKSFGLYEYRSCHPAALSGGQKQRLSIACGILSGRDILIFDEPTSGLDGENLLRVAEAFRQAAEDGKAILLITHDNELITKCCTHLLEMGRT